MGERTPALCDGDRVAVVAPSGRFDADALRRGVAWLRERWEVAEDPRCFARSGYLAGSDELRAAALVDALEDRSVRALHVARGGYGAMRVLERAGARCLAALGGGGKPIVGFSDATALHALWARAGCRSVHGPMVAALGRGCADAAELREVLAGAVPAPWEGLVPWAPGSAVGRAAGGNLSLLAALAGTPWAWDLDGAVLFLEDVTERPYRVDRMLTTLRLAGALRGVRAVVLGEFVQCEPAGDGVTVEAVLREAFEGEGVPVLAGARFGHGERNRPVVLGAPVEVRGDGTVLHREGLAG